MVAAVANKVYDITQSSTISILTDQTITVEGSFDGTNYAALGTGLTEGLHAFQNFVGKIKFTSLSGGTFTHFIDTPSN